MSFVRAVLVSRALRISLLYTVVAVAVERLTDVVLVGVAFLVLSSTVLGGASAGTVVAAVLVVVLAVALLVLFVRLVQEDRRLLRLAWLASGWLNPRLEGRVRFAVWSLVFGFQRFATERERVRRYVVLVAASWACYVAATLVLAAVLVRADAQVSVAAAAAPYAAASPSLGPSLPGPFVAGVAGALAPVLPGGGSGSALFGAVAWLVLVVPVAAVGWVSLLGVLAARRRAPQQAPLLDGYANKLERDEDISGALPSFLSAYFARDRLARVMHDLEVRGQVTLRRTFRGGSNAVTVLASRGDEAFVKKLVPSEHADRLQAQFDWLVARRGQRHLVVALREERGEGHYAIDLEHRPLSVPLHQYVHTHPVASSLARLDEVWQWLTTSVHRVEPPAPHTAERDAYVDVRLVRRVRAAASEHPDLASAVAAARVVVNGVELDGFEDVVARIRAHPTAWAELAAYQASPAVHGDLTVDNILVDMAVGEDGEALVIDPSDDNEVRGPVIDVARLLQSLRYGYEFLTADEEPVPLRHRDDGVPVITYADRRSARYAELDEHVTTHLVPRHLTGVEQRTVLFHVGLFYGRMLTHRVVIDPATALKYLGVALQALNAFIDQYDLPLRDDRESR